MAEVPQTKCVTNQERMERQVEDKRAVPRLQRHFLDLIDEDIGKNSGCQPCAVKLRHVAGRTGKLVMQ
jgi:hypothetical protein